MHSYALALVLAMLLLFGCHNEPRKASKTTLVNQVDANKKDISVRVDQILTCNDTLINCKIDQQDKETEIYVFNIAFINEEVAVIHNFSSAGHTDEGLSKVKYKLDGDKLTLAFPDQELVTSGMPSDAAEPEWEIEPREKLTIELEAVPCGGQFVFKVINEDFYCGLEVKQEYYESFDTIDELINSEPVKEKFALIQLN